MILAGNLPNGIFGSIEMISFSAIRHLSILSPPVLHVNTFFAILLLKGLRATTNGSCAGFKFVPNPSYGFASSDLVLYGSNF